MHAKRKWCNKCVTFTCFRGQPKKKRKEKTWMNKCERKRYDTENNSFFCRRVFFIKVSKSVSLNCGFFLKHSSVEFPPHMREFSPRATLTSSMLFKCDRTAWVSQESIFYLTEKIIYFAVKDIFAWDFFFLYVQNLTENK